MTRSSNGKETMIMGMDVYGNKPKNECGKYFGMNMSGWRSLATYACEVAPAITAKCKHWYSNDFDGLSDDDSILLANLLQESREVRAALALPA